MSDRKVKLSHLARDGQARMVDVSSKNVTVREALASAMIRMKPEVLRALQGGRLPKGDGLATARIAGIAAAKQTSNLIPMCHNLNLEWVSVDFEAAGAGKLRVMCVARTAARTGVEMEALTGAAIAALTIYDMAKSADKAIVIGPVRLERKSGGRSGTYERQKRRRG